MPILVLQHGPEDHLARFAPIFRDHGFKLDVRRLDLWAAAGGRGPGGIPPDFDNVDAVVSLGGAANVGDSVAWMQPELDYLKAAHARALPVIGLCLGHQMIAAALGGEVGPMTTGEAGFCLAHQTIAGNTETVLAGLPWTAHLFQAHAQEVKKLPEGAINLITSPACKVQAFRAGLRTFGFQFHPECTQPDLDVFARSPFFQGLMLQAGLSGGDLAAQAERLFADYDRYATRLALNIVNYVLPAQPRRR